jgi:hypothetical protein
LKNVQDVVFNANFTLNYDSNYKCSFGGQISDAQLFGNQIRCNISKSETDAYSTNVTLMIVSKIKGTSLVFSLNSLQFIFMSKNERFKLLDQIQMESIVPHLETYSVIPNKALADVNLTLRNDLLTTSNIYCKFTSENFEISYSKVEYTSSGSLKQVTCKIIKNITSESVQFVDVELFMNFSSINSFSLSSNNQSYFYIPSVLNWRTKRIIDPRNLNIQLNFAIPPRYRVYKIDMMADIQQSSKVEVDCTFVQDSFPNCSLLLNYFDQLEYLPLKLNFSLRVTHNNTNIDQIVSVQHLIYYKPVPIEHVKPFLISSVERKYLPARIISNVQQFKFNPSFKFKCNSNSFFIHNFKFLQDQCLIFKMQSST